MRKIFLCIIITLAAAMRSYAEDRTFIREYYYQAGESDSKISSRYKALTEVKRLLLEEIGVYIESYINYGIDQVEGQISNQFLQKEIQQISAGITETTIIEESWTGIEFYIKAAITVDPDDVIRRLNHSIEQRKASMVVDSLNQLLTKANISIMEKESEVTALRQSLQEEQEKLRHKEEDLKLLNKELFEIKEKYLEVAKQEQAIQSEIESIRRAFAQSTSKASQVLIGMTIEEVERICGEPRATESCCFNSTEGYLTLMALNYGETTIIIKKSSLLVIKGVRTSELNRFKYVDNCRNIIGSLYSE